MRIRLHRCRQTWLHTQLEACWRVQSALDDAGIEYEVVKHRRTDRDEIRRLTGQPWFPVIEFEDGTAYHEQSRDMAETIRAGRLDEKRST
jgi:glutaredoxin